MQVSMRQQRTQQPDRQGLATQRFDEFRQVIDDSCLLADSGEAGEEWVLRYLALMHAVMEIQLHSVPEIVQEVGRHVSLNGLRMRVERSRSIGGFVERRFLDELHEAGSFMHLKAVPFARDSEQRSRRCVAIDLLVRAGIE